LTNDANTNDKEKLQKECDIESYKIVTEHFRQDIREFWNRANFFLLAQTALLSAFMVGFSTLLPDQIVVILTFLFFGFAMAIFWFFVLRGAVFWIEKWREQVIKLSKEIDRFQCYFEVENLVKKTGLKSPSNLTQYFPLGFAVAWLVIIIWLILKAVGI
jgi:hypothetical protein